MSSSINEENKRWSAKRKSALVLEIIQGKTTVSEASRQFDLTPSELESWVEQAKAGMENALRAKPQDVRQQYEKQISQLQAAYGEAMLELRARKSWWSGWSGTRTDPTFAGAVSGRWAQSEPEPFVYLVWCGSSFSLLSATQKSSGGESLLCRAHQAID